MNTGKLQEKIIDTGYIERIKTLTADEKRVEDILQKALELQGLSFEESAMLLNIEDDSVLEKVFKAAKSLKEKIYGNRIVLFAPLYLSNYCVNNCLYCGFRTDNKEIARHKLTVEQAVEDASQIINMGHKRILLVAGEDTRQCNLDYLKSVIDAIYAAKILNGEIRRLNVNIAPLKTEEYKTLASFGIGTLQVFQETYHPEVYKVMHPKGPKASYNWRVECMSRAIEGGLNDFGMGALFGLTDYRFEVIALLSHSQYLLNTYGIGPHTLSIPRIEPAQGSELSQSPPFAIDDKTFKKIVAVLRLSVPYTGLILTTRESRKMRTEALELGISQMSAGSKTNPGGYTNTCSTEQFTMADTRSINEIVQELCEGGFLPSFCTSCYRLGRVGKDFMELARPGEIKKFCEPNAMATFAEFLTDYADEKTKKSGLEFLDKQLERVENERIKLKIKNDLERIQRGERDLCV